MLREFGIDLTHQSAWIASGALAVMVGAGLPKCRRSSSYLYSSYILTVISSAAVAAVVLALEGLRGGRIHGGVATMRLVQWMLIWAPVAVLASAVANGGRFRDRCALVVASLLAMSLAPQLDAHGWSVSTMLASISNLVAAALLAHDCCQKKI
jgi:hypothetical protein